MMRTIRRTSSKINRGKWQALKQIVHRYAREKQVHLPYFTPAHFAGCSSERTRRDVLVKECYHNSNGLQGRMWKMALKDAYETVLKQWAALAAEIKPRIFQHDGWSETQQHYAYWLLKSPQRLAQLAIGRAPLPSHFSIELKERKTVQNYLRRVIRRHKGSHPRVRKARSFALDADMYGVFEKNGTQYIEVMSLVPRQRIVVPLTGHTPINGNIRIILDEERQRVEVHYTAAVVGAVEADTDELGETLPPDPAEVCGLDAGLTEVFTDEAGQRYGTDFGPFLKQTSETLTDKGRKRNKLHQIAKKARAKGDHAKANRIHKYNLGRKKLRRQARKRNAEMQRQINAAFNRVLKKRQPAVIVTEKLDFRGKAQSKNISRRINVWARRVLKERVEFKASAARCRRKQVNPAYSSQTCPICGYVHRDNRRGDTFQCQQCRHTGDADQVAATNHKARKNDPEIRLCTPKTRVKEILLARFYARLPQGPPEPGGERDAHGPNCFGQDSRRLLHPELNGGQAVQPESETTGAILFTGENVGAKCS
jgi:putative transposase